MVGQRARGAVLPRHRRCDPPPRGRGGHPVETGDAAVTRRTLLKGLGVGGATLVVAGTGAASYRVFDSRALNPASGSAYAAWQHWRDPGPLGIVGAAILAANPHNAQAWRFHVTASGVDVFADTGRGTGTLDGKRREMDIGLGCAIENLMLAAKARGYAPALMMHPVGGAGSVAHVALLPGGLSRPSPLYEALGDRHSNRGPYERKVVPAATLASLGSNAAGLDGVSVRWLSTAGDVAAMGALMVEAAQAITDDAEQSADAFAWFRSSADAIERHKDGLTLDGQGLSPMVTAVAKLLPGSSRAAGDTFWVDQTRSVHTATAAAYGVITVASAQEQISRLSGGRLLQRIHLDVTARGLGLQHMNQITERIDREELLSRPATFAARLAALLHIPGREALCAFRIGYPVRAARRSPRRPVRQVST